MAEEESEYGSGGTLSRYSWQRKNTRRTAEKTDHDNDDYCVSARRDYSIKLSTHASFIHRLLASGKSSDILATQWSMR